MIGDLRTSHKITLCFKQRPVCISLHVVLYKLFCPSKKKKKILHNHLRVLNLAGPTNAYSYNSGIVSSIVNDSCRCGFVRRGCRQHDGNRATNDGDSVPPCNKTECTMLTITYKGLPHDLSDERIVCGYCVAAVIFVRLKENGYSNIIREMLKTSRAV